MDWVKPNSNPVVRVIIELTDSEGHDLIVRSSRMTKANARLMDLYAELRDRSAKEKTLDSFSPNTVGRNWKTSYDRVKIRLIDPDANRYRPIAIRGG